MRFQWLTFAIVLSVMSAGSASASVQEQFRQANRLYEEKSYDSAIAIYSGILRQGVESAALHFNLGNAYFRSGDLGHAILYYHRAKRLDPNDNDIVSNLQFARRFTSIQMEGVKLNPVSSLLTSLVEPFHPDMLAWLTSLSFIMCMLMFTVRYGLNISRAWQRIATTVSLILLIGLGLLTVVKYDREYLTRQGVVIAENSVVRTGPSAYSDKELDAAPGLVVEILSESGDFFRVLFENKRQGWIEKDLVAVI